MWDAAAITTPHDILSQYQVLWNFCNRHFFRLLINLLVSVPTIIKTVTVLSALGEGKGCHYNGTLSSLTWS